MFAGGTVASHEGRTRRPNHRIFRSAKQHPATSNTRTGTAPRATFVEQSYIDYAIQSHPPKDASLAAGLREAGALGRQPVIVERGSWLVHVDYSELALPLESRRTKGALHPLRRSGTRFGEKTELEDRRPVRTRECE